jgi:hypothetical protein
MYGSCIPLDFLSIKDLEKIRKVKKKFEGQSQSPKPKRAWGIKWHEEKSGIF